MKQHKICFNSAYLVVGLFVFIIGIIGSVIYESNLLLSQKQTTSSKAAAPKNLKRIEIDDGTLVDFGNVINFTASKKPSVQVSNSYKVGRFSNVTMEALVYLVPPSVVPSPTPASGGLVNYPILYKKFVGGAKGDSFSYLLGITQNQKVKFYYTIYYGNRWATVELNSNAVIPYNAWTHIAVVYNSIPLSSDNGKLSLFINGNLDSQIDQSGEICGGSESAYGDNVYIGSDGYSYFNGYLDEVRISNTPLYLSKYAPFTIPKPGSASQETLLLFHFNENAGNPSGESNNGVLATTSNNVTYRKSTFVQHDIPPTPTPTISANAGKAAYFNGSGYIAVTDPNNKLILTPNFTFEAWVKPSPSTSDYFLGTIMMRESRFSEDSHIFLRINSATQRSGLSIGNKNIYPPVDIPPNEWTHLAFNRNGPIVNFYINGQFSGNVDIGSTESFPLLPQSLLYIGGYNTDHGLENEFRGVIDDIRISNNSRNIETNWRNGTYFNQLLADQNTIALWNFENNLTDSSASHLNGVAINNNISYVAGRTPLAASPTPTPPYITRQDMCQSLAVSSSFVNSGQSVTITSTTKPNYPANTFSYAFYNLDNVVSPGNPKPLCVTTGGDDVSVTSPCPAGSHQLIYWAPNMTTRNSAFRTLTYTNTFPIDTQTGKQVKRAQINAYFKLGTNPTSLPNAACVRSITATIPTAIPLPTSAPTSRPTLAPQP